MDETITAARGTVRPVERTSPHSDEAEISVLGAMLIEEMAADRAMEILAEEDFHHPAHRHIFRAISRIRDQGHAPDALAVREELRRLSTLDEAGGDEYLARIVDIVPTAANLPYHARIVQDLAVKRRLIRAGTEIVAEAYESADESDHLLNRAEERIFRLSEHRFKRSFTPIGQLLQGAVMQLETLSARREAITGAPTGFKDLDEMTAGFQLSDLVIVAGRPSMGKCVAYDTEIVLDDGSIATIEEICRRREGRVVTLGSDWELRSAAVSRYVDDGVKPVFRVTTRLGRTVETTLTHPFLTIEGWKPLGEVEVGTRIAVPRRLPVFGERKVRDCEVKLIAYLVGDGGPTGSAPRFTNSNPRILEDFEDAIKSYGGVAVHREAVSAGRTPMLRVRSDGVPENRRGFAARLRDHLDSVPLADRQVARAVGVSPASLSFWSRGLCAPSPPRFERLCWVLGVEGATLAPAGPSSIRHWGPSQLAAWLDDLGLMGRRANEKVIPDFVLSLVRPQLVLFLNRLFATDGWARVLKSGQPQLGYATASKRLVRQVQHLLLRFGIIASVRRRRIRYQEGRRTHWQLDITDQRSLRVFVSEIGIFGKEQAIQRLRDSLDRRARDRLAAIAAALDDKALSQLVASDVYWDEIVEIEPTGMKQVYDLTVPTTHNFIANDICVHNTSFCLNVAAHAAIVEDLPVAVFSLEMSMEQLVQRLISTEALVSLKTLRTGQASSEQWKSVADACDRLRRAAIYIDDSGLLSVHEMRAKARRLKQQRDIGLLIVDYLQLMESGMRAESRQQEITEISRSLKALAKELNIPVIALSQLSRGPEHRADQRPRLADLRESGSLEQDADLVLFLYRDEYYNPESTDKKGIAEVIVGKNRNGPTGMVEMAFLANYMRFENLDTFHAMP